MRARINLATIIVLVFLTIVALAVLYPVVYVTSAAFTPGSSIALDLIPFGSGFTLEHFRFLFKNTNYPIWFTNTFIIAISTSICTVVSASLSAYVFSRFRFTLKKTMMMALLILQIFPSFIGMVAIYVILLRIGGLNTLWGLVLVYVAGNIPYNTWLVKSYLDTIPRSLDEAAIIDGASHFRVLADRDARGKADPDLPGDRELHWPVDGLHLPEAIARLTSRLSLWDCSAS